MMKKLTSWILDRLSPYYLVHLLLDGVHVNVFVAGPLGKFAADSRAKKRRIVIVSAWRVSRAEYLMGTKAAVA